MIKTLPSSHNILKNKDIVVLAPNKESCAVILNRDDYITKVNHIIDDEIKRMKYVKTTDDICNELKRFQDFLYHHFHKHEHHQEMQARSNKRGRVFATAKTHKFESIRDIAVATQVTHHY